MFAFGQFDTEFWFAIPYSSTGHDVNNQYRLMFTGSAKPSKVTISVPANPAFIPDTFNLAANSYYTYNFSTKNRASMVFPPANGDTVLNTGIKITATTPVFCYYENYTPPQKSQLNTEIYSLKGKNALGTDFVLPFQNVMHNGIYTPAPRAYFYVVASEDNTVVTITPAKAIKGHAAGIPFTTVPLKAGQVYVGKVESDLPANRPVGTVVTANKKVAITISDDSMGKYYNSSDDIGGDQLVPVNLLGTEYIAVQGYLTSPYDAVFILATKPGYTDVYINGAVHTTLSTGEVTRYNFKKGDEGACYIKTTQDVYVYQISGFRGEVGYSILPPLNCRGSKSVSVTRSSSEDFYLTLLTESIHVNHFTHNLSAIETISPQDFVDVPGTGGAWKYYRKSILLNRLGENGVLKVENSSGLFHLGVIHGGNMTTCKFAYFSDFNSYKFQISAVGSNAGSLCEGNSLHLQSTEYTNASYQWQGPNGYANHTSSVIIPNIQPKDSGWYKITGNVKNCPSTGDSIYVSINPNYHTSVTDSICQGEYYNFYGDSLTTEGLYSKTLKATTGCDSIIELALTVFPAYTFYNTASICQGDSYDFYGQSLTKADTYTKTFKTIHGCDSIIALTLKVNPVYNVSETVSICEGDSYNFYGRILTDADVYIDTLPSIYGCDSIITLTLKVNPVYNISLTGNTCAGTPYPFGNRNLTKTDIYTDSLKSIHGCDSIVTLDLTVYDPSVKIENLTADFCEKYKATLKATPNYDSMNLLWNTGETARMIEVTKSGRYWVQTSLAQCVVRDIISIDKCEEFIYVPNAFTPSNADGVNTLFFVSLKNLDNTSLKSFEISIYNRYGMLVFYSDDIDFTWDGKCKGVMYGNTVYTYIIHYQVEGQKKQQLTGSITVF
jgi:gliding motility-associated-like protein